MKFDTLYKQNSNGSIQQWTISTKSNEVTTIYGQKNGKLQTAIDLVKEGKNLGRSNATTPESQAELQAQQQYEAKLKEGYTTNLELANSTKNVLEAVEPMLAHPIDKKEKYVKFPCLAQPKLDGIRCLAIIKKGKVRLFSRTQKEFVTMPHIVSELETIYRGQTVTFDGELYNHTFKKDFNRIASIIKRDDIHPDHKLVQYHIYDVVVPGTYTQRSQHVDPIDSQGQYCLRVETIPIASRESLEEYQAFCVERSYEGCMYRNPDGPYEHKRSTNLLKVKTFQDAEFEIVDIEEGHGKLMNHVGAFYCKLDNGNLVKASPIGTLDLMAEYWKNRKRLIGKMATIKFQNYTPDGSLRFPKLKCIRDYE